MAYCSKCGREIHGGDKFCPDCGAPIEESKDTSHIASTPVTDAMLEDRKTYRLIAFVFMVIACCTVGWFLISLAWLIPMTSKIYKAYQDPKTDLTLGFKVCVLIFASIPAGVLILLEDVFSE